MLQEITTALSPSGLIPRGGFNFRPADERPAGLSGAPARSVVLIGNGGAGYWPQFARWRRGQPADMSNPLDVWSREVIEAVAAGCGARAAFPSNKPYLPFQQWAMRAEGLRPSPMGILMHPVFGLWHAYRGALLFDIELRGWRRSCASHACDSCEEAPCLKACPVQAYSVSGFARSDCLAHVAGPDGASCRMGGCMDRNACPQGVRYRYPAETQAFHMAAFAR